MWWKDQIEQIRAAQGQYEHICVCWEWNEQWMYLYSSITKAKKFVEFRDQSNTYFWVKDQNKYLGMVASVRTLLLQSGSNLLLLGVLLVL